MRSFPFFIKERSNLCVLFCSTVYKRTFRSLRSFPFFIKERNILFVFISHTNIANLGKKERKKNVPFFLKNVPFFFPIYICLYISIYIYIYFYIYIEKRTERSRILLQKNGTFSRSFLFFAKEWSILSVLFRSLQKNVTFFAFFSVLYKRTLRSFRSFPFFSKERKRT